MRSGIILAGGRSTRFGGGEKSLRPVGGRPMICRVRDALDGVVDELVVSVRDEGQRDLVAPLVPGLTFVYDEVRDIGPLACDMPFLSGKAIGILFERAEGHDAAVPVQENGFLEPLHAVYRREPMLRAVETSMGRNESRISAPLSHLEDVAYVPVEELEKADPGLRTFLNVNRAEDMPQ
jgi:molybdopterin-guanine dinucleotide biosynthesis protein A